MKKSELRQIIKEELLKEQKEVNIWEEIEAVQDIKMRLNALSNKTTDSKWKTAISSILKTVDKLESQISDYDTKLGIIPLK